MPKRPTRSKKAPPRMERLIMLYMHTHIYVLNRERGATKEATKEQLTNLG
jgi:hypothetical protein